MNDDDRHRAGFEQFTRTAAARDQLLKAVTPVERTERVGLQAADNRVVATAIEADRPVPHYKRAAMDGYAVRGADTFGASERSPTSLRVTDTVRAGTATRVHTGSELPEGADAVVKVEATDRTGDELAVVEAVPEGGNVGPVGEDVAAGQALFEAVQKNFFADFRVSIMLDSNGSNTTAAAGVAKLLTSASVKGKKTVILAGTGPVGQRASAMLAMEGAEVALTSRDQKRAEQACQDIETRFGVKVTPIEAKDNAARAKAVEDAQVVFATGAAGAELLSEDDWNKNQSIELMADANATPPLGIGGTGMMDKGKDYDGRIMWGAIGFGTLKLALHRACIEKLFEAHDQVFDAENIFELAKSMD